MIRLGILKIFRLNNSTIKPIEMAKSKLNVFGERVGVKIDLSWLTP